MLLWCHQLCDVLVIRSRVDEMGGDFCRVNFLWVLLGGRSHGHYTGLAYNPLYYLCGSTRLFCFSRLFIIWKSCNSSVFIVGRHTNDKIHLKKESDWIFLKNSLFTVCLIEHTRKCGGYGIVRTKLAGIFSAIFFWIMAILMCFVWAALNTAV